MQEVHEFQVYDADAHKNWYASFMAYVVSIILTWCTYRLHRWTSLVACGKKIRSNVEYSMSKEVGIPQYGYICRFGLLCYFIDHLQLIRLPPKFGLHHRHKNGTVS